MEMVSGGLQLARGRRFRGGGGGAANGCLGLQILPAPSCCVLLADIFVLIVASCSNNTVPSNKTCPKCGNRCASACVAPCLSCWFSWRGVQGNTKHMRSEWFSLCLKRGCKIRAPNPRVVCYLNCKSAPPTRPSKQAVCRGLNCLCLCGCNPKTPVRVCF